MTYLVTITAKSRRFGRSPNMVAQYVMTDDMLAEGVVFAFTQLATASSGAVEDYELHIVPLVAKD